MKLIPMQAQVSQCFRQIFFLLDVSFNPLNASPTKWSNTQTIHQLIADELFECV